MTTPCKILCLTVIQAKLASTCDLMAKPWKAEKSGLQTRFTANPYTSTILEI